jgi:hypothetical protein
LDYYCSMRSSDFRNNLLSHIFGYRLTVTLIKLITTTPGAYWVFDGSSI